MVNGRFGLSCVAAFLWVCACGVTQGNSTQRQQQALIYGEDERVELQTYDGKPAQDLVHRVVAAVVPRNLVTLDDRGVVQVDGPTLAARTGLCPEEGLGDQLSAAVCSAILVGESYFVTAGHCFRADQTEPLVLVLGYIEGETFGRFEAATVHEIEGFLAVVDGSLAEDSGADYAIGVLAERGADGIDLTGTTSRVAEGTSVVVVGTSEGLPLKVDTGGSVFDATPRDYFEVTTDTFAGGSGSPVFTVDGSFLGIVVGGGADYQWDDARGCLTRVRVQTPERAEIVVRTETIQRAIAELPDDAPVVAYPFGVEPGTGHDAGVGTRGAPTTSDVAPTSPLLTRESSCTASPTPRAKGPSNMLWLGIASLFVMLRRAPRLLRAARFTRTRL